MNDVKIVIDAGHGGIDTGASGNGMFEKDYTLLISKYMKERFDELGIPSVLTRDSDETVSPNDRVNRILNAFGNSPSVIVISNHLNAGGGEGSEVIYALRNNGTLSNQILNNLGSTDISPRKAYQRRLPSNPSKDYYFIHRNTGNTEPIIVEYGFIDNKNDANKIKNNYKKYAEEVIKAICNYKGISYTEPRVQEKYIVKKGDTLWNIAKKFNTSVDELKKINNLKSNMLYISQELKVPEYKTVEDSNIKYIVKKDDSLSSISKEFNISTDELIKENNLNSDKLYIGEQLKIPSSKSVINKYQDEIINENDKYIVQKGDTLYSIARKYNTTIDNLKKINNFIGDILEIGSKINVPSNKLTDIIIHKVIKGDSLWSIANKYNTTIDEIKKLNNLVSDLLNVGDELQVKRNTK